MVSTPSYLPPNADAVLHSLARRRDGAVPDLEERLRAAGFSAEHPPTWAGLPRVAPRAKSELAQLQRTRPQFGGLGTSKTPAVVFWSPGGLSEPLPEAAIARLADLFSDAGFTAGDKVANGFAYHFTPAGLLVHEALRRIGACVLPMGPQQLAQAAEFMLTVGATAYVGTASHLKLLLQAMDALPAQPGGTPKLRMALAGAEPFGDDLRRDIEARWGVPCLDFYGTAESGIVALECASHAGMHLHADVLAETVVPGTGERSPEPFGELLLTVDADELPLLRFGTGDLVRVKTEVCGCGRTTPRVVPLGRVGDSARVRGMLIHGSQLRAFARRSGLAACRLEISREAGRDVMTLRLAGTADNAALALLFHDVCRLRVDELIEDATLVPGEVVLKDLRMTRRLEDTQ